VLAGMAVLVAALVLVGMGVIVFGNVGEDSAGTRADGTAAGGSTQRLRSSPPTGTLASQSR
jgi:hypothetical protein